MSLSTKQAETAAIIIKVGQDLNATSQQITAALAAAWQESTMGARAVPGDGGKAFGIFQQHPGKGWGARSYVEDPYNAARSFYLGHGINAGLLDQWQANRSIGQNVQAVQKSADSSGSTYDNQIGPARSTLQQIAGYVRSAIGEGLLTPGSTPKNDSAGPRASVPAFPGIGSSGSAAPAGFKPNPNVARVLLLGVGSVLIILALVKMQGTDTGEFFSPGALLRSDER